MRMMMTQEVWGTSIRYHYNGFYAVGEDAKKEVYIDQVCILVLVYCQISYSRF